MRHQATIATYRSLVNPENPPWEPFLIEHHFFAAEEVDVSGFVRILEERGFAIETFAYDPTSPHRAWSIVAVKLDLLEERRLLTLSDELDELARRMSVTYDGWLTHVE